MSQFDFGNLESPLSGEEFVNDKLEPWRDALHSGHKGSSQPSYVVAGMTWINDSSTPWVVYFFDGTDNIRTGTVNPTTNVFSPAGCANSIIAGDGIDVDNTDPLNPIVSVDSAALEVGDDTITNAKLSEMAANTVKVNSSASSANPTDLALSSSTLVGRGSTGNVAAVTMSTGVTIDGTALRLANAAANTVKANASSSSAAPTDVAIGASQLVGRGSSGDIAAISIGTGLTMTGTTISAAGGSYVSTDQGYSNVGSFCFCRVNDSYCPGLGATVAGSYLYPVGLIASGPTTLTTSLLVASALSGTWRNISAYRGSGYGVSYYELGIFQRIA